MSQPDAPADVSFMRALHAALRRDLSRLRATAAQLGDPAGAPPPVLVGWDAFRAQLGNHHAAEDDDLWPVLRRELSDAADLASVDAMAEEHRQIPPALAGVDAALRGGGELTAPVELLSTVVLDHLAHEEREVFPPHRAAPDAGAVAHVPAQGAAPAFAAPAARVPGLDPRRRRRAGCGGRPHRDATTGPAGLPPDSEAPLRRAAPVADPQPPWLTLRCRS